MKATTRLRKHNAAHIRVLHSQELPLIDGHGNPVKARQRHRFCHDLRDFLSMLAIRSTQRRKRRPNEAVITSLSCWRSPASTRRYRSRKRQCGLWSVVETPYTYARPHDAIAAVGTEWASQWVFPATRFHMDRETGERRRHHLHGSVPQRAVKDAVRAAGIARPATCHSLRHYVPSP